MNSIIQNELESSAAVIHEKIVQNTPLLEHSFADSFNVTAKQYEVMQLAQRKGLLSFCYISYLRSSVTDKFPLFRIDLYDECVLCDLDECAAEWDVSCLTAQIYQDIPMLIKPVPDTTDLREEEIEQLWIEEADRYFSGLKSVIAGIVEPVRKEYNNVEFYFGEYLSNVIKI